MSKMRKMKSTLVSPIYGGEFTDDVNRKASSILSKRKKRKKGEKERDSVVERRNERVHRHALKVKKHERTQFALSLVLHRLRWTKSRDV
jgi:vacuolar-type H+-ATPase subunit H